MKRVIYLESNQNLVWTSMQEILPCLKETWESFSSQNKIELTTIDVDKDTPKEYLKEILKSDAIVVSSFNGRMAQFLEIIRLKLKIDTPWVFYLHGLATVGLWPLVSLGLGECLTDQDLFLGTCEGDRKCLDLALPGANYLQTRFYSDLDKKESLPKVKKEPIKRLVYVGRISRQKNIHQLLWAFKLFKESGQENFSELTLDIYGKEDGLDSPNMGLKRSDYLKELKSICSSLNLTEGVDVNFHGFVKREDICHELEKSPFLFVSFSLHSDENFGMAALMALNAGGKLLLSHWGGHINFVENYPKRASSIAVYLGTNGPCLHPIDCVNSLKLALMEHEIKEDDQTFSLSKAQGDLKRIVNFFEKKTSSAQSQKKIVASPLVSRLINNRSSEEGAQNVFKDYCDDLAHMFFKAYGAQDFTLEVEPLKQGEVSLAPWANWEAGKVVVSDLHRGQWSGDFKEAFLNGYVFKSVR